MKNSGRFRKALTQQPVIARVVAAVLLLALSAAGQNRQGRENLRPFTGVYQLSPGKFIYVQPWPGGGDAKLAYTDESGQFRGLFVAPDGSFFAGPGLLIPSPPQIKIAFTSRPDGAVSDLIRQKTGKAKERAVKLQEYGQEDVKFRSGSAEVGGTLFLPPGPGPHPAMVLLHGTGPADRYTVLPIVHFLVTHGVVLLGYDKRGSGQTAGDWRTSSLGELAGDAAAAVRVLSARSDVDPKKIGFFAVSQGGWVAPLAASRLPNLGFLITVSGPAMSPAEVELQRLSRELSQKGFSQGDNEDARKLFQLAEKVVLGKASWASYTVALQNARGEEWFSLMSIPTTPQSWLVEHWKRMPLDYKPASFIAKLRVPVLSVFGALDQTLIPEENSAAWQRALKRGGNRNFELRIFPRANHMLLEANSGTEKEFPELQRFIPDFQKTLLAWLRSQRIIAD